MCLECHNFCKKKKKWKFLKLLKHTTFKKQVNKMPLIGIIKVETIKNTI